jgi:hypothetical protein
LSKPFLDYLRADGIVLPSDEDAAPVQWSDRGNSIISAPSSDEQSDDDEDEDEDVAAEWRDIHAAISKTIAELGGSIVPKLNWSAPKDATWMNSNTMACRLPSDVYLLLKSSDFVTHDLEHAFDDCVDSPESTIEPNEIPYVLVLRKTIEKINPSLEFRCFVRGRKLLAICQRDLNHYKFLFPLQDKIRAMILEFFAIRLRDVFPDEDFVFDVYIPPPHDRVWLVDFNPWAPRTDPLLFGWLELLTMDEPPESSSQSLNEPLDETKFVRLSIRGTGDNGSTSAFEEDYPDDKYDDDDDDDDDDEEEEADEELWLPELRLVRKDDPEAYSFSTPQYSAHKLPRDVVDAGASGEGLREFAKDWEKLLAKSREEDRHVQSSDEE